MVSYSDLINDGFLGTTGKNKLVFALKCKQIPPGNIWVVFPLKPALCWIGGVLVNLEIRDLLPRAVDAPLTEVVVSPDAIDRRLIRAELNVENLTQVCLPATKTLLLKHV